MSIATNLRTANHELWEQAVRHPFVLDLGSGTLPREMFRDYMAQDYLFIDKLVRLVASGIANAPAGTDRKPLAAFLSTLLGAEDDLFQRVFAGLGAPWPMPSPPEPLPATAHLNSHLTAIAKRSFAHIATTLYVTEGVYADWARRLVDEGRVPDDPLYRGWIDIHADQALADFVAYLDGCIESAGRDSGLDRTFVRTLRLEVAFWDAVYPRGPAGESV